MVANPVEAVLPETSSIYMNIEELTRILLPRNADYLIGYARLTNLLPEKYRGLDYAVVLARKLDDRIIDAIIDGPNIEYYAHYEEVNLELAKVAHGLADTIRLQGSKSLVIEPTIQDKDLDKNFFKTLRFDFSHKMAATRAGLGWIGKTALFISEKYGPRVRLVTVLTDYPLPYCTEPINESQCGSCDLCVRHCPAQAASGKLWNIDVDRNEFFDPFACRKKALELSYHNFSKEISLCGKCIAVCPIGKIQR
jgi:epoxyqueuosine reductase